MLPLTVSFETVLQIFNNNFKQEDVKVGLFPNMRKGHFVHSTISRSRKSFCIFVCSLCLIHCAFPITPGFESYFSCKSQSFLYKWTLRSAMNLGSQCMIRWHSFICLLWQLVSLKERFSWVQHFKHPYSLSTLHCMFRHIYKEEYTNLHMLKHYISKYFFKRECI